MSTYDTSTPRSRQNQRVAYPEALSRSFDHRANALTVLETQGTPYYAGDDGVAKMKISNATNAGLAGDFHPYHHHSIALYVLQNVGAGVRCQVRVTAKTQLGHYVEIFNENCLVETEYRFSSAYREIRVVATATQAGESFDVYLGGA